MKVHPPTKVVNDLEPGDRFNLDGQLVTVQSVERSPDRYHWRVRTDSPNRPLVIVPTGARFTLR